MWEMFVFEKKGKITKRATRQRERILYTRREKCFWPKGKKGRGIDGGKGSCYPKVGIFMLMKITYLYLGLPWEGMERWKGTQRKICIFKKTLGLQNLDHFKGHEKMHVHSA